MDVSTMQAADTHGAGHQQRVSSDVHMSSPNAHSSSSSAFFQQQQPQQHPASPHPSNNLLPSQRQPLDSPEGHAVGTASLHQSTAAQQQPAPQWPGSSMPLPFNLQQFQEHSLSPLRPCDGAYNNGFDQNHSAVADAAGSSYLDPFSADPVAQSATFYDPPHSAPLFHPQGPFEVPAFDNMASYPTHQFDDVADRVKTSRRSVHNPYRESNGAPLMKRMRSNENPRPASAGVAGPSFELSSEANAEPAAKRQRTLVTAGPDPMGPLPVQAAATPLPHSASAANHLSSTEQHQPPVTDQPVARIEGGAKTSKARSSRPSRPNPQKATASEGQAKDAPSSGKPDRVDERSWANILKYTSAAEDLDWTKETDKAKRRHMQMVIASRVRSDKRKAKALGGSSTDSTTAVAGGSSSTKDANTVGQQTHNASTIGKPAQADAPNQPPASAQRPAKSSPAKLIKIRLPKPNQPIAPAAPKGQAVAPYPSPHESAPPEDPAPPEHVEPRDMNDPSPEPEDEEYLRLQVARYESLIKLKMLEHQRRRQHSEASQIAGAESATTSLVSSSTRAVHDVEFDKAWVEACKAEYRQRGKGKKALTFDMQSARRLLNLLEVGQPPDKSEALFLTGEEAAHWVKPGVYFHGPIITDKQQSAPLQKPDEFLDEYPDDHAEVWIQDPEVKLQSATTHCRPTTIEKVKNRLVSGAKKNPWNCLELATHFDDGLRPAFLNNEDCRLLTKLKIPGAQEKAARRGFLEGWKEVEKWALVAQAGALTEPHQDSHGYSTFITVNTGPIGFGWLSNPTAAERKDWNAHNTQFNGGRWRWIVLKNGQTVYFPSGTVHFVFRLTSCGNTLAYGGHVLRCSQIVRWVKTLLEEQAQPNVTNEDLTQSAPGYLERVEKYVKNARRMGQSEKWGGPDAFEEFMRLKQQFFTK